MAGSTSGGSMDGTCVIYDCTGDTLWYMDNPGFGNTLYSGNTIANPCPTIPDVLGCTDDDYVEFNPLANIEEMPPTPEGLELNEIMNTNAFNQSNVPLNTYRYNSNDS